MRLKRYEDEHNTTNCRTSVVLTFTDTFVCTASDVTVESWTERFMTSVIEATSETAVESEVETATGMLLFVGLSKTTE